ncbi:MAG: DUF805 domain-containing protein [Rubrivivax sp.]
MDWFFTALKRYAVFRGRAGRPEYWYFVLLYLVCSFGLSVLDAIAGTVHQRSGAGLFGTVFGLALLLPSFAVGARRLHDIDRTGWWLLISLVPVLGWIVLVVFAAKPGTPGPNRYGAGPEPVA